MERLHVLENEIRPILQELNYDIIRAAIIIENEDRILQIMIDKLDFKEISVKDCVIVSKSLTAFFDDKPPVDGTYQLEVSSPGTERPLTRLNDFENFSGNIVNIKIKDPIDNKKHFSGVLKGISNNKEVKILCGKREIKLPLVNIVKANLTYDEV
tara:strand:+ start:173 stop:637 length:465 start_codon:yes stop_codon:yes gene_type:complete